MAHEPHRDDIRNSVPEKELVRAGDRASPVFFTWMVYLTVLALACFLVYALMNRAEGPRVAPGDSGPGINTNIDERDPPSSNPDTPGVPESPDLDDPDAKGPVFPSPRGEL